MTVIKGNSIVQFYIFPWCLDLNLCYNWLTAMIIKKRRYIKRFAGGGILVISLDVVVRIKPISTRTDLTLFGITFKQLKMFRLPAIFRKGRDLFIYDSSMLNKTQVAQTETCKTGVSTLLWWDHFEYEASKINHVFLFSIRCGEFYPNTVQKVVFMDWPIWAIASVAWLKGDKIYLWIFPNAIHHLKLI